jgi:phosphate/sulfate permease
MKWNLGTWYLGPPASSSHTLIGSVIGVGIANELRAAKTGTSGVDWAQAGSIGKTLLVSPRFIDYVRRLLKLCRWLTFHPEAFV